MSMRHRSANIAESFTLNLLTTLLLLRSTCINHLEKKPLDPANIAFIQEQLRSSITQSRSLESDVFVPKRLVDLGPRQDSTPILVTMNKKKPVHNISMNSPLVQDTRSSIWNQRGWVYQEKSLSRRKLYFGKRQIHFLGGQKIVSENGEVQIIRTECNNLHRNLPKNATLDYLADHKNPRDYWYRTVEQIAHLQWTVQTDLFPSISGLASQFHKVISSQYLAGLWADDLHCGLLWMQDNIGIGLISAPPQVPKTKLEFMNSLKENGSQLGPSWSWARPRSSGINSIVPPLHRLGARIRTHLRPEFSILEACVRTDSANPFGKIRAASLNVFGRVLAPQIEEGALHYKNDHFAELTFDWARPRFSPGFIDKELQAELLMFLVSSCCADPSDPSAPVEETKPIQHAAGELKMMVSQIHRPVYRKLYYNDSHLSGEKARAECSACQGPKARRDVWGFLIYPAERPGTYYRVGAFASRVGLGGSEIFNGAEDRKLELI
ncbi:hypothetical protein F4810DRAFT_721356 [Camillea tinctor]|nr:hypothetical protein F4810DRAFT_721356 [Camillea tinctor]